MNFDTISYNDNKLKIIDQRQLPSRLKIIEARNIKDVYTFIKGLAVRGAPAIGVFSAYGVLLGFKAMNTSNKERFLRQLNQAMDFIEKSRPTAVNLSWALNRMRERVNRNRKKGINAIKDILIKEAVDIHRQDRAMCKKIGLNGARLISKYDSILTHCNAGSLATGGDGTALAVIYRAFREGKKIKVYAGETRPLLQGARLTAWELQRKGVDITLICDTMPAFIMKQGKVDKVIVGADRIARNGDTANKIGTYALAVLAKEHNIPFYVAAPGSTLDMSAKNGSQIPIEERSPEEVRKVSGFYIAPKNVKVYNPAFDITPARFITAIITERGIFRPPYHKSLKRL
jgi:methylthioribose-1-phosphate isomerase